MAINSFIVHTPTGIKKLSNTVKLKNLVKTVLSTCVVLADNLYNILLQAVNKYLLDNQLKFISSINSVYPIDGDLFVLGDACTSIVTADDLSDSLEKPILKNKIIVFDGCQACTDCLTLWQIQNKIKLCQVWINGLKDCLLYYLPGASGLWNSMLLKKSTIDTSDSTMYRAASHCSYTPELKSRLLEYGRALRLLYQYKTLVATWNYLAASLQDRVNISVSLLDFAGFNTCIKRSINLCQNSDSLVDPIYLDVSVKLVLGQTHKQKGKLVLYVCNIPNNSYIEAGTDTGGACNSHTQKILPIISYSQLSLCDVLQANISYIFLPAIKCTSIMSGAFKLIPCYVPYPTAGHFDTLDLYIVARSLNTYITQKDQVTTNRWLIHYVWRNIPGVQEETILDTIYFLTAKSRYPQNDASESSSV